MTERLGDWMQTFTGRAFWPLDPRADEIDTADIAHALSNLCRFGGHVKRFYSVAEHCVLMSEAVAPEFALWALLHDATEAYLVDLPRPIKRHLPSYVAAEGVLMECIAERFGITPFEPAEVKDADNRILLTERAALLTSPPIPWSAALESREPLPVTVTGWHPIDAEAFYRSRLTELLGDSCSSA
jgi:hypothetical protein